MENIYADNILEYADMKKYILEKNLPTDSNSFKSSDLECFDCVGASNNYSCGDKAILYIKLDDTENIIEVKHDSSGCAISVAGMNMICEKILGMNITDLKKSFLPNDIYNMFGVHIGPSRSACALMCYNCFQDIKYIKN